MKKNYNQPEVQVTSVALQSVILTGSGNTMSTYDAISDDQW